MQLTYANPENTSIICVLDDGESLANHPGPATIYVPVDPANAEYAEIVEEGYTIAPYAPPPVPAPNVVGRSQWYGQAAVTELITNQEAIDAMKGEIPGSLDEFIAKVDAAHEQQVQMLLSGGNAFDRTNDTCIAWNTALGWTEKQIEDFWTAASKLA